MLVGYNANSGSDVYRMWNPKTNRIINTRDVLWLKRMYFKRTENAPLEQGVTFRDIEVRREDDDETATAIKVEDEGLYRTATTQHNVLSTNTNSETVRGVYEY